MTAGPIDELHAIASEVGAAGVARDARALGERLREGLFFVAVLGQFKRGKSTLINALIGARVLPAGVPPVTSVITVVRSGALATARVRVGDDGWREIGVDDLASYVSEDGNPENRLRVTAVEIQVASPILEHGVCLVDTPGLGSVLAGNTAETRAFLPHVDAAVLVVGVDPPISADELQLVVDLDPAIREVFVVLSKADRFSPDEIEQANEFTRRTLAERAPDRHCTTFAVSATAALAGEPQSEWLRLRSTLERLAAESGSELIQRARFRETKELRARLRRYVEEQRQALTSPVEVAEQRLVALTACIEEAQRSIGRVRHLFNADHDRLAARLDADGVAFVHCVRPELAREFAIKYDKGASHAKLVSAAIDVVEPAVQAWRELLRPGVEAEFAEIATRYVAEANSLLVALRTATPVADALPEEFVVPTELRARSSYYFAPLMAWSRLGGRARIANVFRGKDGRNSAIERSGLAFVDRLLEVNRNGVVGDYLGRVVESRRSIEAALRSSLAEIAAAATIGARRARELRAAGAEAVRVAVAQLDRSLARLDAIEMDGRPGPKQPT